MPDAKITDETSSENADENADERLDAARFVVSEKGGELLNEIAALSGDAPAHVLMLRKRGLPLAVAALLVETAHARKRARARFGSDAARLFFTSESLAQATSPGIAAYHARYLAPLGTVADLGCGVGIDSIAFARAGASVFAIEQDAARLCFARANAEALGVADTITFVCGNAQTADFEANAAYCDPSRRETVAQSTQTRRVSVSPDHYAPPLGFVADLMRRVQGGCVKLSPALPDLVLFGNFLNGRVEFLSEFRECKEACVWFGEAYGAAEGAPRAAVILPFQSVVLPNIALLPDLAAPTYPLRSNLRAFVYDPDPALIRANALQSLALRIGGGAGFASADDFYLIGSVPAPPEMAQTFLVLHEMTYHPRRLRGWFKENGLQRVIIKKRHFKQEPPQILRELGLPLSGGEGKEVVLILARQARKSFQAFVCEACEPTMIQPK